MFDKGPPAAFAALLDQAPDPPHPEAFWLDWGPVFYRGRANKTARLLCVASDPGPTERIAGRTLVGDAGQRVQGFLAKLGLTRSYVCLNAFPYALIPSRGDGAAAWLKEPPQLKWRNRVFRAAAGPGLQAIVAFGVNAQAAVKLWEDRPPVPVERVPHPSSHDGARLVREWRAAVTRLRAVVTPEAGPAPNYGEAFSEADYAPIPRADLPFGVPWFLGDDRWARGRDVRSSVRRPVPDDRHTLIWSAP